jgi:5-methylcytosine-specific restriction endonuclease McrA
MYVAAHPVLVLNKSWMPIGINPLESAISKLFSTYKNNEPKARIVDAINGFSTYTWNDWSQIRPNDNESVIKTRSTAYRIPEVILLTRYDGFPNRQVPFNRRAIYNRDNNQCQYCGATPGTKELSIDHIIPVSRNGKTNWFNCVIACTKCNRYKANNTPDEIGMKLIRQPFKPKFSIFNIDRRVMPKSWDAFLSELYWNTELENSNKS